MWEAHLHAFNKRGSPIVTCNNYIQPHRYIKPLKPAAGTSE